MSLRQLCRQHSLTIERQGVTATSSASAQKAYNTTNRGSRPRSIYGRVVELSSKESTEYAQRGINASHAVFIEERDPDVGEKDRFVHGDDNLYVTGVINPDRLGRFWKVLCSEGEPR